MRFEAKPRSLRHQLWDVVYRDISDRRPREVSIPLMEGALLDIQLSVATPSQFKIHLGESVEDARCPRA